MTPEKDKCIKVLVVDDSALMRRLISDMLNRYPDIKVVASAKNGEDAIEKVGVFKPDVVTLDVEMPVMNGLKCLEILLEKEYIPVIMLSSVTEAGADTTIKALEIGAVDFVAKPANVFDISGRVKEQELVEKIRVASVTKRSRQPGAEIKPMPLKQTVLAPKSLSLRKIIAIGTSTGGPKALQEVIPLIPGDIPAAVLIVQHMPPGFTRSLAERLDSLSKLTVKEAEDGEAVKPGYAYIAPGDYHMLVGRQRDGGLKINLSHDPPVNGHRPSVDMMMNSVSNLGINDIIAVIMTGMGGDGSVGVKRIKEINRGFVIAQDEKTCVVYGMPRMAVQTGAVDSIVPLNEIADEIIKNLGVDI